MPMIAMLPLAATLLVGSDGSNPFLHPLFSDHAVLQRDVPIPITG